MQEGGHEADDLIGTAVERWQHQVDEILIATGDKDIMQLVTEKVRIIDTMKDLIYGPQEVLQKMGVYPEQIVDYLAMVGDSSDNIPGMKGIGAKGAIGLLAEFGSLEKIIQQREQISNKRLATAFAHYLADGKLSQQLVTINRSAPFNFQLSDVEFVFRPLLGCWDFLQELGFKSLAEKIRDLMPSKMPAPIPALLPTSLQIEATHYQEIIHSPQLQELIDSCPNYSQCQVGIWINWLPPLLGSRGEIHSLAVDLGNQHRYLLLVKSASFLDQDLFSASAVGLELQDVYRLFVALNNQGKNQLIMATSHRWYLWQWQQALPLLRGIGDVNLAGFLLEPDGKNDLEFLTKKYLKRDLLTEGKNKSPTQWESGFLGDFSVSRAQALGQLYPLLMEELARTELLSVYQRIDLPLLPILAHMEFQGILIDPQFFSGLSKEFEHQQAAIEQEIFRLSQIEINLRSPKQVAELLFNKLQLPAQKSNKTGFSTDSAVLEELAALDLHPVPGLLLKYRELEKLLSTYVKVIPQLAQEHTQRVHTHFTINVAATGRLSSVGPNLQNIPIRTENGQRIRRGFIAPPGKRLLSADYSQVELRLLAHFSQDPTMLAAFAAGMDIHASTAAEILEIPVSAITPAERAWAKAVNFGLMYGQSSFGLSQTLGISRSLAKDYITKYFARFSTVKAYLDSLKEQCEKVGYAQTFHGRKRFLPDIYSQNRTIKANAERMAINSPIQGTAADIIKMAMIEITAVLDRYQMDTKLLLQVHDELIFEVPEVELAATMEIVRFQMENVVQMRVPLKVDIHCGDNWLDLK